MITIDFIAILFFGIVIVLAALAILIFGIYVALTYRDMGFCVGMIFCFLCLSALSGIVFNESYKEYKNAIPQNQVKILKQKMTDAEKELQKYLIDHPELKEYE